MRAKGWDAVDVAIVTGDAYVDHPSFGAAVIARVLEDAGFRVGVLPQPDWKDPDAFRVFGRPRLFFGVTAGNVDSLVSRYSPAKVPRKKDDYSPGGKAGLRPPRASITYTAAVRAAYKGVPIVLGGIEASLRRLAHYDYWDDAVRRSVLVDAKADLLVCGMGEKTIVQIAKRLDAGERVKELEDVLGTVVRTRELPKGKYIELPSFEEVQKSKRVFNRAFRKWYTKPDARFAQKHGGAYVVQNPPSAMTTAELDRVYALPFTMRPHPRYGPRPDIPAYTMIRGSITSHRGCFGGCAFCAVGVHQGKRVVSRSRQSVLDEAARLAAQPDFSGTITDVGGPTANMYAASCGRDSCDRPSCVYPDICKHLRIRHHRYFGLLRAVRRIPGVKHVFVGSGIRHDLLIGKDEKYIRELVKNHVGGHLKVAPEHAAAGVLNAMRKPPLAAFREFQRVFNRERKKAEKKVYLVPYFISGHPGTTMEDQLALAWFIRTLGHFPEQLQDFTPTPMTLAAAMFHTGEDPLTNEKVHVPRGREKNEQRALMQYADPRNRAAVVRVLERLGRTDLIGSGPRCLIK
jgi:uncharacterized radical SAM protein YgiQ